MIEYTITYTFDQFKSNFSNRKGKKRGKKHFFLQQNAFFQNPWKWFNFYMQYVYGKVLKCRKQNFCPFPKKWKMTFFYIPKTEYAFLTFLSFSYFCLYWGQFSLVSKMDKNSVFYMSRPFYRQITCKNWTTFTDFPKMYLKAEKSAFSLFFYPCGWKNLI